MRTENLHLIRKEVEISFGRKIITASDCTNLSEEISKKIGNQLNVNTLRRCFGLVKSNYPPSINTLNILSKYCGSSSFSEIIDNHNKKSSSCEFESNESLLTYLISLFRDTNLSNNADITFVKFVKHTINFLKDKPAILNSFQKGIAKTKNGQTFYFEQFVNIDNLNKYYGDGLMHYLMEKKSKDAQLFGNSLLVLRYWLTSNSAKLDFHYNEMVKTGIDETILPVTCARYFASSLLYAEAQGRNKEEILIAARNYYLYAKESFDYYKSFPSFELILAEALVLVKEYEEALFYIEFARKKKAHTVLGHIDLHFFSAIEIYRTFALMKMGNLKKAETVFLKLKPGEFYFLSKQFHLIIYLAVSKSFKRSKSVEVQLNHLIEETGFEKLKDLVFSSALPKKSIRKEELMIVNKIEL